MGPHGDGDDGGACVAVGGTEKLSGRHVSLSLWGLGALKLQPPLNLVHSLCAVLLPAARAEEGPGGRGEGSRGLPAGRQDVADSHSLSVALWGLAQMGYPSEPAWLDAMAEVRGGGRFYLLVHSLS